MIERGSLRQIADASFDLERLLKAIIASDPRDSLGGRHEAGQDPHSCGLAGSVGTEEGQHLALAHREGNPFDGRMIPVTFGDVLNFNHREAELPTVA